MLLVKNLEGLLVGLFRIPPGYKAALLVIINQSSVSSSIKMYLFPSLSVSVFLEVSILEIEIDSGLHEDPQCVSN